MAMIHEACGNETTRGESCSACGEDLVPERMTWLKPWKGARDALVPARVLGDAEHPRASGHHPSSWKSFSVASTMPRPIITTPETMPTTVAARGRFVSTALAP